ncbi:hypothetical protein CRUP_036490 [Coryphaenoides rupestris]|nr:hypothetical protein CRUP_036490 [Coryphaenoides rupestris]
MWVPVSRQRPHKRPEGSLEPGGRVLRSGDKPSASVCVDLLLQHQDQVLWDPELTRPELTMLSDFLSPFLELDEEFCKNVGVKATAADGVAVGLQRARGFQRRHSLCPVSLVNSKFNTPRPRGEEPEQQQGEEPESWGLGGGGGGGGGGWSRDARLPRSALGHIPFRVDRSVSLIEGSPAGVGGEDKMAAGPPCRPPPGLGPSTASLCASSSSLSPPLLRLLLLRLLHLLPVPAGTELCRTFEESGVCKYGAKCQFAHGEEEVRGLHRHPKYKTEPCRTYHTVGFCPYGARCHFIHNADEVQDASSSSSSGPAPPPHPHPPQRPLLRHSYSFAGFSSSSFQPAPSSSSSLLFSRASSVSPPPYSSSSSSSSSSSGSPELLSPLFPEPGALVRQRCPYSFSSALADLTVEPSGDTSSLRFYALTDASSAKRHTATTTAATTSSSTFTSASRSFSAQSAGHHLLPPPPRTPGLRRCSSADSLSEEGYTSSCSLGSSSGSESPCFEGRRLPIFSRLSVTDE